MCLWDRVLERERERECIIWPMYGRLYLILFWPSAPVATWISCRGLWDSGSLMGQTNSSQCEYLHHKIEKIKFYLAMTGALGEQLLLNIHMLATRLCKCVCVWMCVSQYMHICVTEHECAHICQGESLKKCTWGKRKQWVIFSHLWCTDRVLIWRNATGS